jgi:CubicO group peptidase (beta-lactamase class C family)
MLKNLFFSLRELLSTAVADGVFPGASIGIVRSDGINNHNFFFSFGCTDYINHIKVNHNTFYDLASLTKPLASLLSILSLIKYNIINIDDSVSSILGKKYYFSNNNINIIDLLNHRSGMIPYSEFYKKLDTYKEHERKQILIKLINDSLSDDTIEKKQIYSDLGYMLLGLIVEIKANCSLPEYVEKMVYQPLELEKKLFFINGMASDTACYAPTEQCPWRKRLLVGEVHDENASSLGGGAGHAGLFGNVIGVLDLVTFLLDMVQGRREHPHINTCDLQQAVRKQNALGTWGLGFDTPSAEGSSSGSHFSKKSFGHLGFTGTSFWVDPEKDLAIVLLTNRVHPDRQNIKIKKFRPVFHDTVMDILGQG